MIKLDPKGELAEFLKAERQTAKSLLVVSLSRIFTLVMMSSLV